MSLLHVAKAADLLGDPRDFGGLPQPIGRQVLQQFLDAGAVVGNQLVLHQALVGLAEEVPAATARFNCSCNREKTVE